MSKHLSATTHLVKIGEDVVVLDTRTKTYFCMAAAADAVRIGSDGVAIEDVELAQEFLEAGLLTDGPTCNPSPTIGRPERDLGLYVAERVRFSDAALILAAWATMTFSYHFVRFDRLVASARRGRLAELTATPGAGLRSLVAAFERVLPWLPFQGVCLYRSFLLLRVLRWRGYDARWVFGVRTWPFNAHCWLQVGNVVLDDTADRLEDLTPIMVV